MSDEPTSDETGTMETSPELPPPEETSLELPAVIIGERSDEEEEQPRVRILRGRVHQSLALYPAYGVAGLAGVLATHFSVNTGELHPVMILTGWGLLMCWYWVYGIAYRYRRRLMKPFALVMSVLTAGSLTLVAALRGTSMAVPQNGELALRDGQPMMFAVAALTTLSLAIVITHAVYLGRGYREKQLRDTTETDNSSSNESDQSGPSPAPSP